MTEKKKATDVLLEIQDKIDLLFKLCEDSNNNIKHLRKDFNIIKITKAPIITPIIDKVKQIVNQKPTVTAPTVEPPKETNKHSMIEQTVFYKSNQRAVILGNVKIYDIETGSMVKETLIGQNGKWTALLPPGKFRVEIKKGPVGGNKGFINTLSVEVKGEGAPIILERNLV